VSINGLHENDKYCFAVAGFNTKEEISKGIGETGDDIVGC